MFQSGVPAMGPARSGSGRRITRSIARAVLPGRSALSVLPVLSALMLLLPGSGLADTIFVASTADDGSGRTLREAIETANGIDGPSTILFTALPSSRANVISASAIVGPNVPSLNGW